MGEIILAIVIAALGSSGLTKLIEFLIQRKDKKKDQLQEITERLDIAERDSCRTQMLVMMSDYPDEKAEIMKLAEHYFRVLKGDWYLTGLFDSWLKKHGIIKPAWFNTGGEPNE